MKALDILYPGERIVDALRGKSVSNSALTTITLQLRKLATRPNRSFFELGAALTRLSEEFPDDFNIVLSEVNISRRRAYYMIDVFDRFSDFLSHKDRLQAIGWTKLAVLAPVITIENFEELVARAECKTARELSAELKGKVPESGGRCVLLHFSSEDHARLAALMQRYGASRRGRQLIGQEAALLSIISEIESAH